MQLPGSDSLGKGRILQELSPRTEAVRSTLPAETNVERVSNDRSLMAEPVIEHTSRRVSTCISAAFRHTLCVSVPRHISSVGNVSTSKASTWLKRNGG